ncbi:hypothetical protein ED388_04765 [Muribaculaceae bacterium Isolate-007 (NCI)]|nr:hypothetical protein EEL42_03500 [Muribaculaceae bacterium Isolate-100 (HZI)]RXE66299.1 hypothetical protein ED388_04765 [Muribaculaceae bacterium Isolate-007 (NCI)]
MRPIRTCENAQFSAGVSKCYLDMNKVKGAILVPAGTKLLAEITGEALKKLCHASRSERIYPIFPFVEYAKNGGEAQVNDNGYGGAQSTGVSSRTDALTLDKFYPELNSSMLRCMNMKFDVYYWDEKYVLYGENDGTDILAGFPLSTIYPTGVPHPTSSGAASLIANFAFADARASMENLDFRKLDFNPARFLIGLTTVQLVKADSSGNAYKLIEKTGGYDLTPTFGKLISDSPNLISGVSAATYDEDSQTLTLTVTSGATPKLKAPETLFEAGVEGIEQL